MTDQEPMSERTNRIEERKRNAGVLNCACGHSALSHGLIEGEPVGACKRCDCQHGHAALGVPAPLTSYKSSEHQTPFADFDALDKEFGPFTLDPCTALGYHTADVILSRGGSVCTLAGRYTATPSMAGGVNIHGPIMPTESGREIEWTGRVFLNPPWINKPNDPNALWRWVQKAQYSVRFGDAELVCAYLPVKSEQKFWQSYILSEVNTYARRHYVDFSDRLITHATPSGGADIVRFIAGRPKFVGEGNTASSPVPCAVVVWRK